MCCVNNIEFRVLSYTKVRSRTALVLEEFARLFTLLSRATQWLKTRKYVTESINSLIDSAADQPYALEIMCHLMLAEVCLEIPENAWVKTISFHKCRTVRFRLCFLTTAER